MALVDEGGAAECEIYRASQHTLVIPVGRLAAVRGGRRRADSEDTADNSSHRDRTTQTSSLTRHTPSSERRPGPSGASTLPRAATRSAGIQIICRYDSVPESDELPSASCLRPAAAAPAVDIGDFSSIVEIDGDCVIIHSRQEETAAAEAVTRKPEDAEDRVVSEDREVRDDRDVREDTDEEEAVSSEEDEDISSEDDGTDHEDEHDEAPVALGTPISERCRRFYESRLRSRAAAPASLDLTSDAEDTDWGPGSVDSGRESGPDSAIGGHQRDVKPPPKPVNTLERKMKLLRREMWSLMHQDDALFRQLLALNDSIEALKQADAVSLSSASSLSSLPELADEESCSPSSTLSSASSGRQSHLSADSGNYLLLKTKYRSQPQLAAELFTADGGGRLSASRSFAEMSPPSLRQVSPLSLRPLDKLRPPSGHRKQASYDSGIVDQEPRGNT